MASEISNITNTQSKLQQNNSSLSASVASGNTEQGGNFSPVKGPNLPQKSASVPKKVDHHELEQATNKLNEYFQLKHNKLQFQLDDGSGRTVVRVINRDTDEIIRQFPPDEILSLSKIITQHLESVSEENLGLLLETEG